MVSGDTNPTGNCAVIIVVAIILLGKNNGTKEHATLMLFPPVLNVNMLKNVLNQSLQCC